MKESETIKEYANKLLSIANKVRLLGSEFSDSRIVKKIPVTVPERFEAIITSLENTKDLSKLTLVELVNALQAQKQRRRMRADGSVEGALQAKLQINQGEKIKWKKCKKKNFNTQVQWLTLATIMETTTKDFLLASAVAEWVIPLSNVGEGPMLSVKSATSWGIM